MRNYSKQSYNEAIINRNFKALICVYINRKLESILNMKYYIYILRPILKAPVQKL